MSKSPFGSIIEKNYNNRNADTLLKDFKNAISNGADVNHRDKDGDCVFHLILYSCRFLYAMNSEDNLLKFVDVVRLLLENGADPNIKNNEGYTAAECIHSSQREGCSYIEVICRLLEGHQYLL